MIENSHRYSRGKWISFGCGWYVRNCEGSNVEGNIKYTVSVQVISGRSLFWWEIIVRLSTKLACIPCNRDPDVLVSIIGPIFEISFKNLELLMTSTINILNVESYIGNLYKRKMLTEIFHEWTLDKVEKILF